VETKLSASTNPRWARSLLLFALMLAASGLAVALKPQVQASDRVSIELERMIPTAFGEWREDPSASLQVVSPEVQETLGKLYSETLSRTYIDGSGYRIMLSLAYGASQSRELQIHKPEVCYAAQGFNLRNAQFADLRLNEHSVPVMRIVAQAGNRIEPITYWIRSGDYVVRGWYEQNKARLTHGFKGVIPDGLLVRVSSISDDTATAFVNQERFLGEMLKALAEKDRPMLLGKGPE
jgi:EpsI family protein